MNFIGKIFVVLIFILSIVFMTLSAVVYSTHKNWEQIAKQAQSDLDVTRQRLQAKESEFNRAKSELEAQKESQAQQVRKLESERDVLDGRSINLQREVDDLRSQWAEASAAVASTQQSNNLTTEENQQLRSDIIVAQQRMDTAFANAVLAQDELQQISRELEVAAEQNAALLSQVGRMTSVMREEGLDPATSVDDVTPRIDGFVQAVARRGSQVLIQISIGADDGLKKGHRVEVFRGSKYLGRAEILKVDPDKAIGRVDPRYQEGRIQEADRVATRLNLG